MNPFQGITVPSSGGKINPNADTVGKIIGTILPYLFAGAGILLLLYLIAGGVGYMTSAGDPKKAEAAKGKITNALVGFFLVVLAYFVVQVIARVLGVEDIKNIFG